MLKSMTGIGVVSDNFKETTLNIEIKSVNHRYLDIYFRMPNLFNIWEQDFRNLIKRKIKRGKVSVSIYFENTGQLFSNVKVDVTLAEHYYNAMKELSSALRLPNEVKVIDFLSMKGVFDLKESEPDEDLKNFLIEKINEAIRLINEMRAVEGTHLEKDIADRLKLLETLIKKVEDSKHLIVEKYKSRINENIDKIFGDKRGMLNENRVEFEITQFSDKVDITEEIVRFNSHLDKFFKTIDEEPPVGKKLDFILQELNREANTIASKNNLTELSETVIEIKTQIEKIREQVQNIE